MEKEKSNCYTLINWQEGVSTTALSTATTAATTTATTMTSTDGFFHFEEKYL
jgi:hypothetical protein